MSVMPSQQGFARNGDGSYTVIEKKLPYGKVTGTYISGILNQNPWQTPFSVAARMLRLFNEDISDKPSVHAGIIMEPKILDYIGALHGDEIFEKRAGDHETWVSDFEDPIFGGHIDGLMPDGSLVEIKTSSRPQDWDGKIPVHYHMQASLYAHFLETDRIVFGVGFTDRETLSDPDRWVPDKTNTIKVETTVMDGFDGMLEEAERIYRDTVLKDRTPVPDMSNPIDAQIVAYLNAQLWTDNEVCGKISEVSGLTDKADELKKITESIEEAKTLFSLYMDYNNVSNMEYEGITVSRGTYKRTSIDSNQLKKDGLYDLYAKEKEFRSIKIKRK